MYKVLTPLKAQFVKQDGEPLEVIVLLITYDIYHLVYREVLETQLGSAYILRHIYRRTVRAQQQFLIKAFLGEVSPYRVIITTVEETLLESLLHFLLTFKIGLALIVCLVK